jgi:hypothetical protein
MIYRWTGDGPHQGKVLWPPPRLPTIKDIGCKVCGLGFRDWSLGFGVQNVEIV